jgi:hypothetical protein
MPKRFDWVHDKILQPRKIKRQSVRQLLPLPSTGTTVREAHVSYGETRLALGC